MTRNPRFRALSIFFGVASLSFTLPARANEPVQLQLRWYHQFQFAGYYAAQMRGFYRNVGLDVEIREQAPGGDSIPFVLEKTSRYAIGNAALVAERAAGEPLVIASVIYQHSPEILLSLASSGIREPRDLIGKKVMVRAHRPSETVIFKTMLVAEGIDPSKVNWIPHKRSTNALLDRTADAISAYISVQPAQLEARQIPYRIMDPRSYGIDFYGDLIYTSEANVHANSAQVHNFVRASRQGWVYAFEHRDEVVTAGLP